MYQKDEDVVTEVSAMFKFIDNALIVHQVRDDHFQ